MCRTFPSFPQAKNFSLNRAFDGRCDFARALRIKKEFKMNQVDAVRNFTATEPTFLPLNDSSQQPRAFQGPLLGLLIAASLLAKASQIRLPYFPDYDVNPWTPFKHSPNYLLHRAPAGYVEEHPSTVSPQIQSPPLNQQQIIHIHDSPSKKGEAESEIYQDVNERNHQQIINTIRKGVEEDEATTAGYVIENDSSASGDVISINFPQNTSSEFGEDMSATNTFYERQRFGGANNNKRRRVNKPASTTRRETHKRPGYQSYDDDYQETRNRNRKRPSKRRPTTPSYDDYDNPNRRKRRPPPKNKNPGRRPINNPVTYYDSNEYGGDDYYDDYNYQNDFNIFARQGTTTTTTTEDETETSETTETTKTTTSSATTTTTGTTETTGTSTHPSNSTGGYTYGPPHTGYGPSNGNENISITYGPPTGPKQETLGPLFDAWYNHYSKNSIFRRLQELLTPNNFYNQHYDVNYHDNF